MQNPLIETEPDIWLQIEPLLDTAVTGLSKADHDAVVLRFFDGKSMKEVGAALGASEDAAKMRVNRAIEKLRRFFAKRGIVVPVAVLTAAISTSSVQSAPASLAKITTTVALGKGATASTSTLTLIQGVLKIMAWTKAKMAIATGVAALLVAATATVVVQNRSQPVPAASNPETVQIPAGPQGGGPDHPAARPNPNARFANLTPQQRVQQARQHYPESVDDLRKKGRLP